MLVLIIHYQINSNICKRKQKQNKNKNKTKTTTPQKTEETSDTSYNFVAFPGRP